MLNLPGRAVSHWIQSLLQASVERLLARLSDPSPAEAQRHHESPGTSPPGDVPNRNSWNGKFQWFMLRFQFHDPKTNNICVPKLSTTMLVLRRCMNPRIGVSATSRTSLWLPSRTNELTLELLASVHGIAYKKLMFFL